LKPPEPFTGSVDDVKRKKKKRGEKEEGGGRAEEGKGHRHSRRLTRGDSNTVPSSQGEMEEEEVEEEWSWSGSLDFVVE